MSETIKHKTNYAKGVYCKNKKDTFSNIGLMQHQIEFSESEYLTISEIANVLCSGQSLSSGSLKEVDHNDIDWSRIDNENYSYEVIDGILYKMGIYKKIDVETINGNTKRVLFYDENDEKELIKYKEPKKVINYRKKDINFDRTQILYFDFDEDITIKRAVTIARDNDMDISLLYPTFSHLTKKYDGTNEYIEKFRLLHVLPFIITDAKTYSTLITLIGNNIYNGKQDPQVKNAVNLIHGTFHNPLILNDSAILSLDKIKEILSLDSSIKWNLDEKTNIFTIEHKLIVKGKKRKQLNNKKVRKFIKNNSSKSVNIKNILEHYKNLIGINKDLDLFLNLKLNTTGTRGIIIGIGYAWNEIGFDLDHFYMIANMNRPVYDFETELMGFINDENRDGAYISKQLLNDFGMFDYTIANHDLLRSDFWYNKLDSMRNDITCSTEIVDIEVDTEYIENIKKYLPTITPKNNNAYPTFNFTKKLTLDDFMEESKQEKVLIIADTGLGKTHRIISEFGGDSNSIFILPNTANVDQIYKNDYYQSQGIQCFYEGSKNSKYNDYSGLSIATWDSSWKFHGELDYCFVDEIHTLTLGTYRPKAIETMTRISDRARCLVHVTATPDNLDLNIYDKIIYFNKPDKKEIPVDINVMYTPKFNEFVKLAIEENNKLDDTDKNKTTILVMKQDKKYLSNINDSTDNSDYVSSETKFDNATMKRIVDTSFIGEFNHLLHTDLFSQGLNIKDNIHFTLYIDNIKDITTIKQYIARFRNAKSITVYLNVKNDEKENNNQILTFDEIYKNIKMNINKNIDKYNVRIDDDIFYSKEFISISEGIKMDTITNRYYLSEVVLTKLSYSRYISQIKQGGLIIQLKNYFDSVSLMILENDLFKTIEDNYTKKSEISLIDDINTILKNDKNKKTTKKNEIDRYRYKKYKKLKKESHTNEYILNSLILDENDKMKKVVRLRKSLNKMKIEGIQSGVLLDMINAFVQLKKNKIQRHEFTNDKLKSYLLDIKIKYNFQQSVPSIRTIFNTFFNVTEVGKIGRKKSYKIYNWTNQSIVDEINNNEIYKMIEPESNLKCTKQIVLKMINS